MGSRVGPLRLLLPTPEHGESLRRTSGGGRESNSPGNLRPPTGFEGGWGESNRVHAGPCWYVFTREKSMRVHPIPCGSMNGCHQSVTTVEPAADWVPRYWTDCHTEFGPHEEGPVTRTTVVGMLRVMG